ncbi:MAG: biotin-dependent carboxyltransferase family protein [Intrasporangium sp.]|uniref:5-oxoprolinase subunit C family protein n=1 Tax=Intrasporangium sp. TaxID=1925024 RepID=UPI0026490148|nr:biotin-dependent carboxyltransferase family protein [Intrasporangium sp.]MDN5795925.1 biotin-dependent carboxyltransferase family protein [Intrasporangium sp.]
MSLVEVLAPGPLTLLEDAGRPGHMAVGVGRAGAADQDSYRLGGRLLGNRPGLAALEVTLGGLHVRAQGDLTVCLTGAPAPGSLDGRPVPHAAPFTFRDGQELRLGMPPTGLRTYLSVRGGLAVHAVLGSRSSDTMSGLGPAAVAAGDRLTVGEAVESFPNVDVAPVPPPGSGTVELAVLPGPRRDWFARPEALGESCWVVSGRSDRKGIRFEGEPVERHTDWAEAELPSEGMVRGAIQVPPGGQPVLFLNDHPVTGGYPVIGVVRSADIDRAAQLRPGQQVRFRWENR